MRWISGHPGKVTFLVALVLFVSLPALVGQSSSNGTPTQPSAPMQPALPVPPLILLDAAHGGSDPGALLNPAIPEKDVTLMFARHLQQQLQTRGISASLLRDSDLSLSTDQRAAAVNSTRPDLYICIHASSLGNGIRIFTAMLPAAGDNRGPFLNWQTAQATSATRSAWAAQQITAAIQKMGFPVRGLTAPLQPLNNITVPALAIEIAPASGKVMQLASTDYQDMVSAALANAVATTTPALRSPLFQPPQASQPTGKAAAQ